MPELSWLRDKDGKRGAGAGAALVTLLGWFSLRGTLNTPPHQVLRSA